MTTDTDLDQPGFGLDTITPKPVAFPASANTPIWDALISEWEVTDDDA